MLTGLFMSRLQGHPLEDYLTVIGLRLEAIARGLDWQ